MEMKETFLTNFSLIANASFFTLSPQKLKNIEMPLDIVMVGSILYTFIFLFGVLGNLLIVCVLIKEKELRSFTNYLLANLAIADCN